MSKEKQVVMRMMDMGQAEPGGIYTNEQLTEAVKEEIGDDELAIRKIVKSMIDLGFLQSAGLGRWRIRKDI